MTGIFRTADLIAAGLSPRTIKQCVSAGKLQHPSHGWYATPDADEALVLAAKTHTQLGCLSAAQFHKLWVPRPRVDFTGQVNPAGRMTAFTPTAYGPATELHLHLNNNASASAVRARIVQATGGKTYGVTHRHPKVAHSLVATVEDAIEVIARYHSAETALVVIESAVYQGRVTKDWVRSLLSRLPRSRRNPLVEFQSSSESGTETRVAHYFRRRRVRVRQQVPITPDIRVDALIGKSLVVESDSFIYHGTRESYAKDRWRAATLESLGFNVVHLSYEQVWDYWDHTRKLLDALIAQRKHERNVRSWNPQIDF